MQGFKDFILRGNLIELAVAFIMGTAFAAVVVSFTQVIMDVLGKFGGNPDFSSVTVGGVNIGVFLTALVGFLILSAIVYFCIVLPYNKAKDRFKKVEEETAITSEELLTEIRDLLKERPTV